LVLGSSSDYLGRRPVCLVVALIVELAAMIMFAFAANIWWVITARAIQGAATGASSGAFTAALVELAPAHRRALGSTIGAAAPAAGLGFGALLTGLVIQFSTHAAPIVFGTLIATMAVGLIIAITAPETGVRRHGARQALKPTISVPSSARAEFIASVPLQLSAWMLAALFMGLIPLVVTQMFGIHSGFVIGATVAVEPLAAAVASAYVARALATATDGLGFE
jgi:MFS family permease